MEEEVEAPLEKPEPELPTPSFWEKIKINKFKILGGVLGIFVFAGAVFGAYKLGQRQVQPTSQPTPTPEVVATPTPDPTANWKTYRYTEISEYAYSIRYPPDWSFKEGPGGLIVDFGPVTFYSPGKSYIYSRITLLREGGFTFEEIVNNAKLYLDDLKEESIKVQGLDATKLSGTMNEKSNPAEIGYYSQQIFVKGDNEIYLLGLVQNPQEDYTQTFNLMLSTFRFLEEEISWVRKKFDEAWDVEYPAGWTVNEGGLIEGWILLKGVYKGDSYEVSMGYPIGLGFIEGPPPDLTLQDWVDHELSFLSSTQRAGLQITDVTVAGAPAKKILNLPEKIYDDGKTRRYSEKPTHMVYIWRRGSKSPSTISIKQAGGTFDSGKMETLLDRLIEGIR